MIFYTKIFGGVFVETVSKVACAQVDAKFGDIQANVEKCITYIKKAAEEGCSLVVFPECFLQGYAVNSAEEVAELAIPLEDESIKKINAACRENNIMAAVGYIEDRKGKYYNSAVLLGPDGVLQTYSKMHMPFIGADKFVEKGQPPTPPVETPIGRISMIICYDVRFPELSRHLALHGADMILMLTNWPRGSEKTREIFPIARAFENGVYVLATNRVGDERGSHFIGGSRIISPTAQILSQAEEEETLLVAEIDVTKARQKKFVSVEGNWSVDIFNDRRPEVFGNLNIIC